MAKRTDNLYQILDTVKLAIESSCSTLGTPNIDPGNIKAANVTISEANRKLREQLNNLTFHESYDED